MTKILSNKSSVNLDYPICRPSLDLDFTQEVLDNRITFTRGSIGTRVNRNRLIETVSANQPRFDYDPVTGECKGLLIEESRTNLTNYSEDFSNARWSRSGLTLTSNTTEIFAPDNSNNASKLIETSANSAHFQFNFNAYGIVANTVYTASIFIKSINKQFVQLVFDDNATTNGGRVNFDLINATITSSANYGTGTGISGTIIKFLNGWYRISITSTAGTTSTLGRFSVNGITSGSSGLFPGYAGNTANGYYIWGAQVEVGAFPTSYIPTTASTVTRSADNASMTGTNFSSWYNQSEGTFFTQAKSIATISGSTRRFLEVSNGGAGQRYLLGYSGTSNTRFLVTFSGVNVVDIISTASPSSGVKMCASYSTNNFAQSTNGVLSTRDLQGTVPTVDRMILGWDNITTNAILCGTISRLTYYPRALKPNQLQMLTS